ncbi:uncharacterized protein ANIA_11513 [Aspergillus nidulans FGSC A4]|uniref:Uncharacterized protein n=1 Tax=Emericella nidulans (strain FGSC A4 / ATCC 38163 / CBS 112.46 / NRRL 194 / M139) TaxID=227321 RepID=C8V060_EMENI|nr:hypothetical protein [Aspergillus nidulans FGSC A4]CBF69401.1 TPA: hypothetical protein ANIA_11513 [Aspergillus nidulans FGSC A4]
MNDFPYITICGLANLFDSHKYDDWQPHAAATAVKFANEFLSHRESAQDSEPQNCLLTAATLWISQCIGVWNQVVAYSRKKYA